MAKLEAMIDVETLDIGPRSIIIGIGAVKFTGNYDSPDEFFATPSIDWQIQKLQSTGSEGTLHWWLQQPEGVRNMMFPDKRDYPPDVIGSFLRYLQGVEVFWVNGSQFDMVILEHFMLGAGKPWKYDQVRDLRTMRHEAGIEKTWEPDAMWKARTGGLPHDPVYDCKFQVQVLREARRRLGVKVEPDLV